MKFSKEFSKFLDSFWNFVRLRQIRHFTTLPKDAPYDIEEEIVDINCYQNCIGNANCNEEWFIAFDEIEYVPPGKA